MAKNVSTYGMSKPISFVTRVARQANNYSTVVLWLLYTVFKGRTRALVIAIVLNAIYAVYWYALQMEQTGIATVPFWHLQVNLKDQPEWLWVVVIFSTACFVTSACLLFLSRRLVFDIAEKHYGQSLEKLVLLARHLPDPRTRTASYLLNDYGLGGLSTGCRRGALIATAFANAISALIGATGAAVFLLLIDSPLTLLILVAAVLAALLLYPLALRAVLSAKAREKAQGAFKLEVRQLSEQRAPELAAESVKSAHALASAFMMRRRVLTELVFAIEIGITVILGLVIYYMASQALAGRAEWAIFIAYIGALRITLAGCSQAIQAYASISRYYPRIVRYYLFVKDLQKIHATPLARVHQGDTIILGTLPNGADVVATAGQRLAMATSDSAPQVRLALLGAKLPHSTSPLGTTIIDPASAWAGDEAAVAVIYLPPLDDGAAQMRALEDVLKDKVALITYGNSNGVGLLGEEYLLTIADGELHRFVQLGTSESEAALKEILSMAAKRGNRVLFDNDEDEDEE